MSASFTFLLPAPDPRDADDALAWLDEDAVPLLRAIGAGVERTRVGAQGAVFEVLLADLTAIVSFALRMARGGRPARPAPSLEPADRATFDWASDHLGAALTALRRPPPPARDARRGLAILEAVLRARRAAASDAARAALVLPRGR